MLTLLPQWPAAARDVPRVFKPVARLKHDSDIPPHDLWALSSARALARRRAAARCSGTTGTWGELMFQNTADYNAFSSSAAEGSLLGGVADQPVLPALFFFNKQGRHRACSLLARGILGTTSTPTITWQVRLGTTAGSSFLSGTSVGVSSAITTGSGVSNKWWELRLDLQCNTAGVGTGATILSCNGYVTSPGGFASPFIYPLEPSTPDTAVWTATIDNTLTYYLNLSVTWSASSASNTVTAKQVQFWGLN